MSQQDRAEACEATRKQRGSAVVLVPLVLLVVVVGLAVLTRTARTVQARAHAQQAADAAVLAALVEGEAGASRLAHANGAIVVRAEVDTDHAFVEVVRDGVRAQARAERREEAAG